MPSYLVPFVKNSLRQIQNRRILLLRLTPPMEGFSSDDLGKILHTQLNGWLGYTAVKKCRRKLQPPE